MEQVEFKRVIVLENNGSNYPAWKFQIIIILRTAGVYDIFDKSRLPGASEESKKKWSEDDLEAQRHCERDCWFKKKKVEQRSSTRSNYALMSNTEGESKCDWYLDSGASQHMTFNRSWLKNYEKLKRVYYISKSILSSVMERDLKCSLFSASGVADKGYTIITNKRQCKIIKDNEIIILGERDGHLFRLKMDLEKDTQAYVGSKENRSLKLGHEILVHQNVTQCRKILKHFGFEHNENEEFQCKSCIYGKQTRFFFPNSTTVTSKPDDEVNFSQAMESKEWKKAMKKEIDAQLQNQTWKLTSLPHNKKSLNCMWIYKLKSNGLHKASHTERGRQIRYYQERIKVQKSEIADMRNTIDERDKKSRQTISTQTRITTNNKTTQTENDMKKTINCAIQTAATVNYEKRAIDLEMDIIELNNLMKNMLTSIETLTQENTLYRKKIDLLKNDIHSSNVTKKEGKDKIISYRSEVKRKILIVSNYRGRNLSIYLRKLLGDNYIIESIVKPNADDNELIYTVQHNADRLNVNDMVVLWPNKSTSDLVEKILIPLGNTRCTIITVPYLQELVLQNQ
ncbi:hypothetical protein JTB14_022596 [Gonioctena quinquepunctata]|nr:hypothetical protein JTB14_022596 [Gonioctena quinquepunctata]